MNQWITKITPTEGVTLITLEAVPSSIAFLSDVFGAVSKAEINVDMISQTAPTGNTVTVSFTVSDDDMTKVLSLIKSMSEKYPNVRSLVSSSNVKISLFGESLPDHFGVAAHAFEALNGAGVDILLITTSDVDISILIPQASYEFAFSALKKAFSL